MRRMFALVCFALGCSGGIEGPAPSLTAAANRLLPGASPAIVCNAQGDPSGGWLVDLTGDGFSPLPLDTVSGAEGLQMPSVALAGPESYALPDARVLFIDRTRLPLAMPTANTAPDAKALQAGSYDLTLTNPDGMQASLTAALTIVPPPAVSGLVVLDSNGQPTGNRLCNNRAQTVVVFGSAFRTGSATSASFVPASGATIAMPASAVSVKSALVINVSVPAGTLASMATPAGADVGVRVNDPDGCVAPWPGGSTAATVRVVTTCP